MFVIRLFINVKGAVKNEKPVGGQKEKVRMSVWYTMGSCALSVGIVSLHALD